MNMLQSSKLYIILGVIIQIVKMWFLYSIYMYFGKEIKYYVRRNYKYYTNEREKQAGSQKLKYKNNNQMYVCIRQIGFRFSFSNAFAGLTLFIRDGCAHEGSFA